MPHADTAIRRTVHPAHARALADHGPGWAIMWDDRHHQPVIARPEHGDDGALLEICDYEDMFFLWGDCDTCGDAHTCEACMPGGRPDFPVIATHMTDILGDFYLDRDDIATYMPLTLPYTRALTEHGFQRRFQGHREDHAFNQFYRSPDGRLVKLKIPLSPTPAPAPAVPLTIEWTYLGLTSADASYPVTDVPADTPPADIAALINTHLAIHPPTPTTNGTNSTNSTQDTDAADTAHTPATT